MSLKKKLGLPISDKCLLVQAVEWLVSREPIIPVDIMARDHSFPMLPGKLDDAIYGEAKEALYLALRGGKISATGIFWGDDPKTDPREDTTVEIGSRRWNWRSVDWVDSSLKSSHESGRYGLVWIATKELFEFFGDPNSDRTESETNIKNSSRRGRKQKYDWNAFYAEIAVRADLDGLPETAAELQRNMAEWCQDTWGAEPGETMLKEKIAPIYRHPRKREGR